MPAGDTDLDEFFDHGVSDGLPVVPPTRARVSRAVVMSGRDGSELVAEVPPNYGRATVEKIAVNAVMAGCQDRKSTRLNSSHSQISYAVFCLKKKKKYLISNLCCAHQRNVALAANYSV